MKEIIDKAVRGGFDLNAPRYFKDLEIIEKNCGSDVVEIFFTVIMFDIEFLKACAIYMLKNHSTKCAVHIPICRNPYEDEDTINAMKEVLAIGLVLSEDRKEYLDKMMS